jgi:hypothetical protein
VGLRVGVVRWGPSPSPAKRSPSNKARKASFGHYPDDGAAAMDVDMTIVVRHYDFSKV